MVKQPDSLPDIEPEHEPNAETAIVATMPTTMVDAANDPIKLPSLPQARREHRRGRGVGGKRHLYHQKHPRLLPGQLVDEDCGPEAQAANSSSRKMV